MMSCGAITVGFLENSVWSLAHRIVPQGDTITRKNNNENDLPNSFILFCNIIVKGKLDGHNI